METGRELLPAVQSMTPTIAASVVAVFALTLDYLRERRLEQRTQDQLDDHERRLRAIERPAPSP